MKKLKPFLISLSLVFSFLFLTACGGNPPINQLDLKPSLNTSGNYIESNEEEFNSIINNESYTNDVNGIRYYLKSEQKDLVMDLNMIMKFDFNEIAQNQIMPTQFAAKIKMSGYSVGVGIDEIETSMYVNNCSENKVYMDVKYGKESQKVYMTNFNLDSYLGSIGGGNSPDLEFDPSNFSEMIKSLINDNNANIFYSKTEKNTSGIINYKLSVRPSLNEGNSGEEIINSNESNVSLDLYLVVKEVEDKMYFQGISLEMLSSYNTGEEVESSKVSLIMTLFNDNIQFPDFNNFAYGGEFNM